MTYALVKNGAVVKHPYNFAQLRDDNPQTSFPADPSDVHLANWDVLFVAPAPQPAHDPVTQNISETTPTLVGGVWTQTWAVSAAAAEEIARRQKRAADDATSASLKADAFVASFAAMTPAQVSTYVDNNTATLATMRALVKKMAQMLLLMARREFGE